MSDEGYSGFSLGGATPSHAPMFRRALWIAGAVLVATGLLGVAVNTWQLARGYRLLCAPPPFRYSEGPPHKEEMEFQASFQIEVRQLLQAVWMWLGAYLVIAVAGGAAGVMANRGAKPPAANRRFRTRWVLVISLSYLAVVSIGVFLQSRHTEDWSEHGWSDPRDTQIIVRSIRPEGVTATSGYGLTEQDLRDLRENLSKDARIVPVRTFKAQAIHANNACNADLILTTPGYAEHHKLFRGKGLVPVRPGLPVLIESDEPEQIERGRGFFSEEDESRLHRVAVLGAEVAKRLFPDDDPMGRDILIKNAGRWTVIGVLKSEAPYLAYDEVKSDGGVYLALRAFQARLGGTVTPIGGGPTLKEMQFSHIIVFAQDRAGLQSLTKTIQETLQKNHGAVEDWTVSSSLMKLNVRHE